MRNRWAVTGKIRVDKTGYILKGKLQWYLWIEISLFRLLGEKNIY